MTETPSIRCAAAQFQHTPGDRARNLEIMDGMVRDAAAKGVQLLVFPECCISGYWHLRNLSREQLLELAEPAFEGLSGQRLMQWAKEFQMTVGGGIVELDDNGDLYNTYVVAMPDGRFAKHRKLHCFINAEMKSGDAYTVFDTPQGWRVAVLICYDNNIVENVRACALAGAKLLLAPHQTGGCDSGSPFAMGVVERALWDNREADPEAIEAEFKGDKGRGWLMRWLPARAHDNGMFLAFSNGVGLDDNEVRTGNAMLLAPYGRIFDETWAAGDALVVAELDPSLLATSTGQRWMRARRPELYHPLTQSTGAEEDTRAVRFEHLD